MAKEFFVSSSWITAMKVPKKTPYGVDLTYCTNAFRTLDQAVTAGSAGDIYHVYNKTVTIDNASLKLRNIRSQEIKSTVNNDPDKKTYSAKSTIKAAGALIVSGTAADKLNVAGFQNVTIYDKVHNVSGGYNVHGGSNTIVHTYAETSNTQKTSYNFKESATIRARADGNLTVSGGAHVLRADGAWATAIGFTWASPTTGISGGISSGEAAFIPTDPGAPNLEAWGEQLMDSPLSTGLPGYYRVMLEAGAKADILIGGGLAYDHIYDLTYAVPAALTKSCGYLSYTDGILLVSSGASVGSAYNYGTVSISGGDFALLKAGNTSRAAITTHREPNLTSFKNTSESVFSSGATGRLSLVDLTKWAHVRDVSGYAFVTVANAELDSVDAASFRVWSKETDEVGIADRQFKETVTNIDSVTHGQTGELSNPKGKVGGTFKRDVVGFGKVTLANATIKGDLAAVAFESPSQMTGTFHAAGNFSRGETRVLSGNNETLVQSKLNEKFTCIATGGVTLNGGEVGKGILGYRTVKLTDVKVGSSISAGIVGYDVVSTMSRNLGGGTGSSLYVDRDSATVLGTLNMAGGALSGGNVFEFATVTLDGVQGKVGALDARNATTSRRLNVSSGGGVTLLNDSCTSKYEAAVGELTVKQGGKLAINGVYGYNKINVNGGTIANGIDQGWVYRSYDSSGSAYDPKAGTSKYSLNAFTNSAFGGSVQLYGVTVAAGGIYGYKTVTLDNATVSGGIGRKETVNPGPITNPAPAPVVSGGIYAPNFVSHYASSIYDNGGERLISALEIYATSTAAAMDLTLKDGAEVSGDIYGAKTLTVIGSGQIKGNVDMASEADSKRDSTAYNAKTNLTTGTTISSAFHSATGAIALNSCYIGSSPTLAEIIVGGYVGSDVIGAAKVTATVMGAGNLDGRTTSKYDKSVIVRDEGNNWISLTGNLSRVDSAVGAATLSTAFVGDLDGFANVTLKDGLIGSANGATEREAYSMSWTSGGAYQHSSGASLEAGNTFNGDYARVSGGIVGYKTVVLENGARVVGNIDCDQSKFSETVTAMLSGGNAYAQTLTRENSTTAAATLTLKTAADVYGNVYGVKTANLTGGAEIFGDLDMNGWSEKETNKVTSNAKTKLFEQTWNSSDGMVGGAALSLNKAYISDDEDTDWTEGSVYGVTKVTMTDAEIAGDVYGGSSYYSSSIVATGSKIESDGAITTGGVISVTSDSAVEWNEKDIEVTSAAGAFTMTEGMVGGAISGFATVKLTGEPGYTTVGRVTGGFTSALTSHAYKNQADTFAESTKEGVFGTLNAASVTFTDADILAERFATVTLTDCVGSGGAIWGGFSEMSRNGIGNGANFAAASANAGSAAFNYKYAASGAVTATRTDLNGGDIINCATVTLTDCAVGNIDIEPDYTVAKTALTFAGSNTVAGIGGFAAVTVKGGDTVADGYADTTGNDTFTVNAGAGIALYAVSFQGGDDKVTVNGTLRLLGGIRKGGNLTVTGTGAIAVIDGNYDAVKDTLAGCGVELINAGETEGAVLAIRTRKEELADNTAKGAVKFEGTNMNGWLSGDTAGEGKFADTEDWIKFKYEAGRDYSVTLEEAGRHGDVQVDLCRNGSVIRNVEWNGGCFDIDETALSAGTEYQLRLTTTENKAALAYAFNKIG